MHKCNPSGYSNFLRPILEPIIDNIEILEEYLTKIEYMYFSKNPQTILLYNIIQNRLLFNHLQRMIIKKLLNYAIFNKKIKCRYESKNFYSILRKNKKWEKLRL